MPLTAKGEEIRGAMEKEYGEKKGEEVFYASRNKGTISGVDAAPRFAVEYREGGKGKVAYFDTRGDVMRFFQSCKGDMSCTDICAYDGDREIARSDAAGVRNAKLDAALAKSIRADAALARPDKEVSEEEFERELKYYLQKGFSRAEGIKRLKTDGITLGKTRKDADGPVEEAARKANMSVEDYLAQRKKASPGHLRDLQKREMEI